MIPRKACAPARRQHGMAHGDRRLSPRLIFHVRPRGAPDDSGYTPAHETMTIRRIDDGLRLDVEEAALNDK